MVDTFRNLGVEAVPGVGHPFDPNFHEAIVSEPNDDVPDGTVLQEFRKGFQCGDRLIRPAMVKVHTLQLNTSSLNTLRPVAEEPREAWEHLELLHIHLPTCTVILFLL